MKCENADGILATKPQNKTETPKTEKHSAMNRVLNLYWKGSLIKISTYEDIRGEDMYHEGSGQRYCLTVWYTF